MTKLEKRIISDIEKNGKFDRIKIAKGGEVFGYLKGDPDYYNQDTNIGGGKILRQYFFRRF